MKDAFLTLFLRAKRYMNFREKVLPTESEKQHKVFRFTFFFLVRHIEASTLYSKLL